MFNEYFSTNYFYNHVLEMETNELVLEETAADNFRSDPSPQLFSELWLRS